MPYSKACAFPKNLQEISAAARLICHPARIQILQLLTTNGPTNVKSLLKKIPLSKPGISRHLHELRKAGLISFEEKGSYIYYDVELDVLFDMTTQFNHFSRLNKLEV
jgi:DNA-binding transcriptional ArsR family regulator